MVRAAVGREETRRSAAKRKELRAVMGEKKKRDEDVGLSIDRKMRGKRETLHFLFSSATTKKKKRPRSRRQSSTPSPSLSFSLRKPRGDDDAFPRHQRFYEVETARTTPAREPRPEARGHQSSSTPFSTRGAERG